MRLAIVHYHLRKGGVTRVISSALEALGDTLEKAVVFSSTPSEEALPCPVVVIPELAYTTEPSPVLASILHDRLCAEAEAHLGGLPDLWHVHNHCLGKNVNFPEVLKKLLRGKACLLLQIHDFAEDGRPANYGAQLAAFNEGIFSDFDKSLYPVASQIGYAVLNGRDRDILLRSGIPEKQVFWLPNAVTCPSAEFDAESRTQRTRESPLILYPTRGIRRKNLGELLLMAAMSPKYHYATTLSPKNPEWEAIHADWISTAKDLNLPVSLALGEEDGEMFAALINEAESMVTTSVGEGFGLAFLEPWLLGKPVVGRDLPEITRDFQSNGIRLPDLYSEWPVPCEFFDHTTQKKRFEASAHQVYSAYQRELSSDAIDTAWRSLTRDGSIDFACLDETGQTEVLYSVISDKRQQELSMPVQLSEINRSVLATNRELIMKNYGLDQYGKSLQSIYDQLLASIPTEPQAAFADRILDGFLDLERLRLLRT